MPTTAVAGATGTTTNCSISSNGAGRGRETLAWAEGRLLPALDAARFAYTAIGGYSLAGLFALWAAYQTGRFKGVAAASPSVWFPGFTDYMKAREIQTKAVYLSLGDKEEKARNPVTAAVGDRIREAYALLSERGVKSALEWNEGNHFKDADVRTAQAFSWVIQD